MAVTQPILDLMLVDTHSAFSIGFADISQYPTNMPIVSPTIEITPSGFPTVSLEFNPNSINIYTSENFGFTCEGVPLQELPDGIYDVKYSIAPSYERFVVKSFIRIDKIMESFNTAFMKLDMMECDGPIQEQKRKELDTIYYYIQGAVAAANKCAPDLAIKMYRKANTMLTYFLKNKCNCI